MNAITPDLFEDLRPTELEAKGTREFFEIMRRSNAKELQVLTLISTGNASWKFRVRYPETIDPITAKHPTI